MHSSVEEESEGMRRMAKGVLGPKSGLSLVLDRSEKSAWGICGLAEVLAAVNGLGVGDE